jgi:hypothetical protein
VPPGASPCIPRLPSLNRPHVVAPSRPSRSIKPTREPCGYPFTLPHPPPRPHTRRPIPEPAAAAVALLSATAAPPSPSCATGASQQGEEDHLLSKQCACVFLCNACSPEMAEPPCWMWCCCGRPSHPLDLLVVFAAFLAPRRAQPRPKPWPGARDRASSGELRRRAPPCAVATARPPPLSCARHPGRPILNRRRRLDRGIPPWPWSTMDPWTRSTARSTAAPTAQSMINGADRAQLWSTQSLAGYFAEKPPSFF